MNKTIQLNNGLVVLAKTYEGKLCAVTYANRTQAYRKAEQLGAGWTVYGLRPFYVGPDKQDPVAAQQRAKAMP